MAQLSNKREKPEFGRYEITFYKEGDRHQETLGIKHQAQRLAQNLLDQGYYPVVVYDVIAQNWVELDPEVIL